MVKRNDKGSLNVILFSFKEEDLNRRSADQREEKRTGMSAAATEAARRKAAGSGRPAGKSSSGHKKEKLVNTIDRGSLRAIPFYFAEEGLNRRIAGWRK